MKIFALLALSVSLLSGCASTVAIREVSSTDPNKALTNVLHKYVDAKGRIDFEGLSHDMRELEEYVSYVSRVSPESSPGSFPDASSRLAYYLNAYNALSMYNVIHFEIPETNSGFFRKFKFFYLTKYPIGGHEMSLYAFEKDVIRALGDPRVHVALNCMSRGCPRLPQVPFVGKTLDAQLDAQAMEFYNEERNVQVNAEKKVVRLSEILKFFTEDFLKKAPSLIAYVNQYRKEKIPNDYEVEFIDYDWTINRQPKPAAEKVSMN